jgi:hypothetical protein
MSEEKSESMGKQLLNVNQSLLMKVDLAFGIRVLILYIRLRLKEYIKFYQWHQTYRSPGIRNKNRTKNITQMYFKIFQYLTVTAIVQAQTKKHQI